MTKIRCKICNDIIESKYNGHWMQCKCGKCYIDETEYYCRIGGDKENWEIAKEDEVVYIEGVDKEIAGL